MKPTVSVVMPCYQCEATVRRTVLSVQAQTFEDWELIAVDDGSADGTAAILAELSAREPRLRVLRQENRGVSAARNAGIEAARGEWLAFVDADDTLPPDALRALLSLQGDGADVLCGACELAQGGKSTLLLSAHGDKRAMLESLVRTDSALHHMVAKLYRVSLVRARGLRVPEDVKVGEDVLFNLRACVASGAWRVCDENVYRYEFRADSAMGRARRDVYRASGPLLAGVGRFLRENDLQTALFRAHLDLYLRTLRADRGRLRAALSMREAAREVTRGVRPGELPLKQRAYYLALRVCPPLSYFIP